MSTTALNPEKAQMAPEPKHICLTDGLRLDLKTPQKLLTEATRHVKTYWWPKLCWSAHQKDIMNTKLFEDKWFDKGGMLNYNHPAYWKIVNALGVFYIKIRTKYPDMNMSDWRVRWWLDQGDTVYLRVDSKRGQSFRAKTPKTGWIDFGMELKTLRSLRDTGKIPQELLDNAPFFTKAEQTALANMVSKGGSMVASCTKTNYGATAFSHTQQSVLSAIANDAVKSPNGVRPSKPALNMGIKEWVDSQQKEDYFSPKTFDSTAVSKSGTDRPTASAKASGSFVKPDNPVDDPYTDEQSGDTTLKKRTSSRSVKPTIDEAATTHDSNTILDSPPMDGHSGGEPSDISASSNLTVKGHRKQSDASADWTMIFLQDDLDHNEPAPPGYVYRKGNGMPAHKGVITRKRGWLL
ncbi:hypothetical protein N0V90_000325 [Kalmusia sp. IMI 367209]|nr:hypothetical protein N0V90_000325 [Kalmusia sp. IMI 367209]